MLITQAAKRAQCSVSYGQMGSIPRASSQPTTSGLVRHQPLLQSQVLPAAGPEACFAAAGALACGSSAEA